MRRSTVLVAVAVAVAGAAAAACGGGGGGGGPSASVGSAGGALASLPDIGEEAFVVFADLRRAGEVAGVEPVDEFELLIALTTETGAEVPSAVMSISALRNGSLADETGIDLADIGAMAEVSAPPNGAQVLTGTFDVDAIVDAVGGEREGDAVVAGDELEPDLDAGGVLRGALGMGIAVVPTASRVVLARTLDDATAAFQGTDPLSGDDDLGAVAAALDGAGAYAGGLLRPEGIDAAAIGAGAAFVDGQHVLVLATAYADEDAADDGAQRTQERLEEGGPRGVDYDELFDDAEVSVEGRVVVLTAQPDNPRLWYLLLAAQDPILAPPS